MPEDLVDIKSLAREVGVTGTAVRAFLRRTYPDDAPGSGARWGLTAEQIAAVRAHPWPQPSSETAGSDGSRPGTPRGIPAASTGSMSVYQDHWTWEGNVQAHVVGLLAAEGWRVTRVADTATKQRGDDIVAVDAAGRQLCVEVKGYPWFGYADPRRRSEKKRTNPRLQAKHWFADVLLHSLRTQSRLVDVAVAIALPDFPLYRGLLDETRGALDRLGVGVILVTAQGATWWSTPRLAT